MTEEASAESVLTTFIFPDLAVRGAIVQVAEGWEEWLTRRNYPQTVQALLGQAMAAAPLMASILKFKGKLSLQAEGDGAVPMLVVQSSNELEVRGMARCSTEIGGAANPALFGKGRLGLILEPSGDGQKYEALVPLEGERLSDCLAGYFRQSEQLDTHLQLSADARVFGGLMLQRMPSEASEDEDAWSRLTALAETLTEEELLDLGAEELLNRLFHEELVEVFPRRPVTIACNCSHGRTSQLLLGMGEEEVHSILDEQGHVEMECGFCGHMYAYQAADIDLLFAAEQAEPPTDTRH